jgi:hypothetical protein
MGKIYVIDDRDICQEIKWGRGRNFKEFVMFFVFFSFFVRILILPSLNQAKIAYVWV